MRLREYQTRRLGREELRGEEAEEIVERFGSIMTVEWPSGGNGNCWGLTPGGTVGLVRLRSGRTIEIATKVPVANIFRMLEIAWEIEIRAEKGSVAVASIEDLYRRLAVTLARNVERRRRIGLHRDYISRTDRLPVVRGRLDLATTLASPWRVEPLCDYREQTSDVMENRILSWTLDRILRRGLFDRIDHDDNTHEADRIASARRTVMNAYRGISSSAPAREVSPADCTDRTYTRLTEDYRPIHALCRFFLEALGPTARSGDRQSFPFLLDMNRLFEAYVAARLAKERPGGYFYSSHERRPIGNRTEKSIDVDIVARREPGGPITAVLDTKYKRHSTPSNADLFQIVSYAAYFGATEAWLIYPTAVEPFDVTWGGSGVRVRTIGIDLEGKSEPGPLLYDPEAARLEEAA